jgi:hypothetical protein
VVYIHFLSLLHSPAQRPVVRLTRDTDLKEANRRKAGGGKLCLDLTSPREFARPKVIELGKIYRSNLKVDVPLMLSLTKKIPGEQRLRLQGGVKDLYANSVALSTQ